MKGASVLALVGFCGVMLAFLSAQTVAAGPSVHFFKVGGRTIAGKAKEVCVLEGFWRDGTRFRYEAWDRCADLQVRAVDEAEARRLMRPREGEGENLGGARGYLEVSNQFSAVLIHGGPDGRVAEVTVAD